MSGRLIRLLPRTLYDYSNQAATQTARVQVAQRFDATGWQEATLIARLHPSSTINTNQTVTINLVADGFTLDEPNAIFQSSLVNVVFNPASITALPVLTIKPVKGDGTNNGYFGALLSVYMDFATGSTTGGFKPIISLDLSVKNAAG